MLINGFKQISQYILIETPSFCFSIRDFNRMAQWHHFNVPQELKNKTNRTRFIFQLTFFKNNDIKLILRYYC